MTEIETCVIHNLIHLWKCYTNDNLCKNVQNVLGAIKCNHFVEVIRIHQEIVMEIKLCRLEEYSALVFGKRQVIIDCIVDVSVVDGYLTTSYNVYKQLQYRTMSRMKQ